jgi:hypothetical protein
MCGISLYLTSARAEIPSSCLPRKAWRELLRGFYPPTYNLLSPEIFALHPQNPPLMLKLYKYIDHQLHYWETWHEDETRAMVHWGIVGQRGEDKAIQGKSAADVRRAVQQETAERLQEGYAEWDEDELAYLELEYIIDGFGTDEDLDKRGRLEDHLDELLGWTGLGKVDGGSIGSGTMEVGCTVADFDIAKKVIEEDFKNTEFGNYSRIYRMDG